MPRMTTTERTAIATPANGLQVYDTDTKSQWFYNGTAWVEGSNTANGLWKQDTVDQISLTFPNGKDNVQFLNTGFKIIDKTNPTFDRPSGTTFSPFTQNFYNSYNENVIRSSNILIRNAAVGASDANSLITIVDNSDTRVNKSTIGLRNVITVNNNNANNQNELYGISNYVNPYGAGTVTLVSGIQSGVQLAASSLATNTYSILANTTSSQTSSQNNMYGGYFQNSFTNTGTLSNLSVLSSNVSFNGTGNITNMYLFKGSYLGTHSGTITNAYDFYAGNYATGSTITNKYGLYILGATKKNYLEGNVGIGTAAPVEKLEVAGAIKIGSTATATPAAGTIRFNTSTSKFEGYDGTTWVAFH